MSRGEAIMYEVTYTLVFGIIVLPLACIWLILIIFVKLVEFFERK